MTFTGSKQFSNGLGFKMLFSFHTQHTVPQQLDNGMFNCSVGHYPAFQKHLACNLLTECLAGEDENERCWFSSQACRGKMASESKCLFTVFQEEIKNVSDTDTDTHTDAVRSALSGFGYVRKLNQAAVYDKVCQNRGGKLVVIHTQQQLLDVYTLLDMGKNADHCHRYITSSVYGNKTLPKIYRHMWTTTDGFVLYGLRILPRLRAFKSKNIYNFEYEECLVLGPSHVYADMIQPCRTRFDTSMCGAVCEMQAVNNANGAGQESNQNAGQSTREQNKDDQHSAVEPSESRRVWTLTSQLDALYLVSCPDGHLTHLFLLCDVDTNCGQRHFTDHCVYP
jgi:hypothetical protein